MIYVGIATYSGQIHHTTVGGLFNVAYAMGRAGKGICLDVIPHDCFIDHARDLMAHRFLSIPDATDMVMIDADVGFGADEFIALMNVHSVDVVAGVYPYKEDEEHYPVAIAQPPIKKGKLVAMLYGPAGFLRIKRRVFEKLREIVPKYQDNEHGLLSEFFPITKSHVRHGEDAGFCRLANAAGFSVFALEGLNLLHTGEKTWRGNWTAEKRGADFRTVHVGDKSVQKASEKVAA